MIDTSNNIGADSSASGVVIKDPTDADNAASDFQGFLQLLTAQLRNQDPLSPIDSTQFIEQLASFSSVEQQIKTNTKLDNLAESLVGANLEQATQWIGKDVEVETDLASFEGDALTYRMPKDGVADTQVEFVISNASGKAIYNERLSASAETFTWDGTTNDGGTAIHGDYKVSVKYTNEEGTAETKMPTGFMSVSEARLIDSSVKLVLGNGISIDPASVLAIRASNVAETDS